MIDTLLAYTTARDASLNLASVDLNPLVAEVVKDRISHLTEAERPEVHLAPLPMVQADPAMLRHVLDNLIGNALKYVRPQTVARVEVRPGPAPHGWARIEVADRGIGIPDQHKPAVFETLSPGARQLRICRHRSGPGDLQDHRRATRRRYRGGRQPRRRYLLPLHSAADHPIMRRLPAGPPGRRVPGLPGRRGGPRPGRPATRTGRPAGSPAPGPGPSARAACRAARPGRR